MLAVMYGHQMLLTLITSVTLFNTIIACVVHVFLRKDYSLTEAEIAIACTFLVAIYSRFGQVPVLQSLNKIDKLEEETLIDTMTRCWNRKFLNNLIELDFFKSKDVSIILGDVNNFKSVNDTLGHTQGDVVLIRVGAQLKRICDMYDETWEVRIGGDEFIVVTKQKNVDELMQELYVACNTDETIMAMDIDIKVAFGKASNTTGKKTYQEMYEEADKEMYINKSKMKRSD
jgi:diguanylate cyclase (GGDEF)-like protein